MEPIVRSGNQALHPQLVEATAQTQQVPSGDVDYLRRALLDAQKQNLELKEQMASKESSWEEEKMKILEALRSERAIRKDAQKGLKVQNQDYHEELSAELRSLQEDLERREKQVVEMEAMWKQTVMALEEQLLQEVAEKVESFMRVQELEENINLLTQNNPDLQVQLLQTPSKLLKESEDHIAELASENAALKEQLATKESDWEEEKNRILTALRSERVIRKQAQTDLKTKEEEYQEQIHSLIHHLDVKENELRLAEQFWTGERDRISASWEEKAAKVSETWEKELQLASVQKDLLAKTLQEESDRKVSQVVLEKDEVIAQLTAAIEALKVQILERETQLEEKERQLIRIEEDHYTQLATLEADMRSQLASKEKTFEELRRNTSNMERDWTNQLSFMEDQIRVLNNTTTILQERLLSFEESNQENMTSEELKAQKKNLKRLIKEKEEEEKRQKKERQEREKKEKEEQKKREKEESKRLKKEKQEREKKEKEEQKKREKEESKRLKKEKQEREKKEKEDLKKEKLKGGGRKRGERRRQRNNFLSLSLWTFSLLIPPSDPPTLHPYTRPGLHQASSSLPSSIHPLFLPQ